MRRSIGYLLLLTVILCMAAGCDRYLRRSAEDIRTDLLKEYPLGSMLADVEAKLRAKNINPQVHLNVGFLKQEGEKDVAVGDQSIDAYLGTYRSSMLSRTSVTVFWGFNAQSELIDIWVWKTVDAP